VRSSVRIQAASDPIVLDDDLVVAGENGGVLERLPEGFFDLIYMDPPFNTGRAQSRHSLSVVASADGDRIGFGGRRYRTRLLQSLSYDDAFGDYLAFLEPRLARARELLAPHGTLYFHIDYREAHYCKLLLDELFGRDAFLNELIWSYDYGAKPRRRWPAKHDTILVYVRTPGAHLFEADAVEREPYMAPGLVSAEKAVRGKRPTDVWFHTIVPTNSREKTGYPTQKPEGVLRRIVAASSRPGGWCLDPFAGSGTLGAVCQRLGRRFVLVDHNPVAVEVMGSRLAKAPPSGAAVESATAPDPRARVERTARPLAGGG
jgi:site-specific DNA-methyltransferase (adenine-specific)